MLVSTDGLPGPEIVNRLGKPVHVQAQVGARPGTPGLAQRQAVAPADVHLQQGAGHRIEAGGEHDAVELERLAGGVHASGRDLLDGPPWLMSTSFTCGRLKVS
jgi:hypothetical protein